MVKVVPAVPIAYFTVGVSCNGYAERKSFGTFHHPSEPVDHYKMTIYPEPGRMMEWTPNDWITDLLVS